MRSHKAFSFHKRTRDNVFRNVDNIDFTFESNQILIMFGDSILE